MAENKFWFRDPIWRHAALELEVEDMLFTKKSEFQDVSIFANPELGNVLALGGVVNTTEKDEIGYHEMIAHVPLFAHPDPRRVLIIGGGDGGTMREATRHPGVEEVVQVEIDEVVVNACKEFLPGLAVGFDHPKANLIIGDGLAYVKDADDKSFDVILVDSTDPVDAGVVLFTPEFYRSCFRVLKDDGILVPQSDTATFKPKMVEMIGATLLEIFPVLRFYTTNVPTYPGGLWTFSFASKKYDPFQRLDRERVQAMEEQLRYYHYDLHHAAFVLPRYIQNLVAPFTR